MRRKRGFTLAETMTAGASAVIVGGIALAAFFATSSASAMAISRHAASQNMYKLTVGLRNDIEQATKFERVSATNLKLTSKDDVTGVESVVEYKLTTTTPLKLERKVDGVLDDDATTRLDQLTFTKINESCVSYLLTIPATSSEPSMKFKGEVRLRNWVKK
jgi:hypothetical protein